VVERISGRHLQRCERAQALLPAAAAAPKEPVLVLYGSQTGTAEGLAKKTAKEAEARGLAPRVVSLEKYESIEWAKESNVLLITSTYGDGDPPDMAQAFWQWLKGDTAPRMDHLRYSVLALGDTNYSAFCAFGKSCDERLAALGAQRLHDRRDCEWITKRPRRNGRTASSHISRRRRARPRRPRR
jgi:sulfite reductase (NADPH) flavoprotein alpha-component